MLRCGTLQNRYILREICAIGSEDDLAKTIETFSGLTLKWNPTKNYFLSAMTEVAHGLN